MAYPGAILPVQSIRDCASRIGSSRHADLGAVSPQSSGWFAATTHLSDGNSLFADRSALRGQPSTDGLNGNQLGALTDLFGNVLVFQIGQKLRERFGISRVDLIRVHSKAHNDLLFCISRGRY